MGWLMTVPQALMALAIVTPIGLVGAWLQRVAMRAFGRDLTGWLGLASLLIFVVAVVVYYCPNPSLLSLNAALVLTLLSSLMAFLGLGALTWGRHQGAPILMGTLFLLLALPLIAVSVFLVFIVAWSAAHLDK